MSVDVTAKSTIHTSDDLDIDACQECYNKLVNRVKEVITKLGGKP
ncbi:MAG: hypothetical protein Q8K86_09070 [Candidatus Nanopelagicaceae bacterium]|nr:hypothetical protein [Candidatus Nanopelagicaceae bacterium]